MRKIKLVTELTRWRDYYGMVLIITFIGIFVAQPQDLIKIIIVTFANLTSCAFAFMINDIEDADDDTLDLSKKRRNPVSSGKLKRENAYLLSVITALISIIFYSFLGMKIAILGITGIILGFAYSYKKIRLKSKPFADFISHGIFLGLIFFITAILISENTIDWYLIIFPGMGIFTLSAISDINNEIRDYHVDRIAGLKNTANMINLLKLKRIFYVISSVLGVLFYYYFIVKSSNLTKILLIGIIEIFGIVYALNWNKFKTNYFKYSYKQLFLASIGFTLLLNRI